MPTLGCFEASTAEVVAAKVSNDCNRIAEAQAQDFIAIRPPDKLCALRRPANFGASVPSAGIRSTVSAKIEKGSGPSFSTNHLKDKHLTDGLPFPRDDLGRLCQ